MLQSHKLLHDEIDGLPIEKVGKAISFIRYLKQEQEAVLYLEQTEETELHNILDTEDGIQSAEMLALIKELPDD